MNDSLPRLSAEHEILRTLHEDGDSATFLVRHRLLGEERVARVWSTRDEAGQGAMERAKTASRLVHPNIVRVVDFSLEDSQRAWVILERVPGVDFGQLLAQNVALAPALVAEVGQQVLRAVAYVHGRGLVLQGLGPDSFVLTTSVDDGPLVKLSDAGTWLDSRRSGRRWAPPEGTSGSPAGDVWVVGSLLRALTRCGGARTPDALQPVLARALEVDPSRRWESAGAMGRALKKTGLAAPEALRTPACSVPSLLERLRGRDTSPGASPVSAGEAPSPGSALDSESTVRVDTGSMQALVGTRNPAAPQAGTVSVDTAAMAAVRSESAPPASRQGSGDREETVRIDTGPMAALEDEEVSSVTLPALVAEAREARRSGDLARASRVLGRAVALRPTSVRLRRLRDEIESDMREAGAGRAGDPALRSLQADIEERIAAGDLGVAKKRLAEARRAHGSDDRWHRLEAEIDAEQADRDAATQSLVGRVRSALAGPSLRDAETLLDELEARSPDHPEVPGLRRDLAHRALEALDASHVTLRQAREAVDTVQQSDPDPTIRGLLDRADELVARGALDEALEVLATARQAAPDHGPAPGPPARAPDAWRTTSPSVGPPSAYETLPPTPFSEVAADLRTPSLPPNALGAPPPPAPAPPPEPKGPEPIPPVGDLTLRGLGAVDAAADDEPSIRITGPEISPVRSGRRHRGGSRLPWILLALLVAALSAWLGTRLAEWNSGSGTGPGGAVEVEDVAPPDL